jgi:hypothetical protein
MRWALSTTTPCRARSRSKLGWLLLVPHVMMPLALGELPFLGWSVCGFFSAALLLDLLALPTPDEERAEASGWCGWWWF